MSLGKEKKGGIKKLASSVGKPLFKKFAHVLAVTLLRFVFLSKKPHA